MQLYERSLFDILSNDERIIVLSVLDEDKIITWNKSDTLQAWIKKSFPYCKTGDMWLEIDILTQSGYGPKNYDEARQVALTWHTGGYDEKV